MESFGYLFIDMKNPDMEVVSDLVSEGKEGGIPFFGFDHSIKIPEVMGLRTDGLPIHGPIIITKEVSVQSPKLQKLLCTMMPIPEIALRWFKTEGHTVHKIYEIKMEHCQIVGVRTQVADVREVEQARITETVSIHYKTIRWEAGVEGASFFDFDTATSFKPGNQF